MLKKHSRLTKETIEKHLLRGRRIKTSRFLVLYSVIPGNKLPQVSVTVSKKTAKLAVTRNKLRRRGYAAAAPLLSGLSPASIILLSYLSPDIKTPLGELREELKQAFIQAKIYK